MEEVKLSVKARREQAALEASTARMRAERRQLEEYAKELEAIVRRKQEVIRRQQEFLAEIEAEKSRILTGYRNVPGSLQTCYARAI